MWCFVSIRMYFQVTKITSCFAGTRRSYRRCHQAISVLKSNLRICLSGKKSLYFVLGALRFSGKLPKKNWPNLLTAGIRAHMQAEVSPKSKLLPPRKLTVHPWKIVIGRQAFPFEMAPFYRTFINFRGAKTEGWHENTLPYRLCFQRHTSHLEYSIEMHP